MNLLLDTHILLWSLDNYTRIPSGALQIIQAPENQVYASSISILEIVIKVQVGKLQVPLNFEKQISLQGIQILPFESSHALAMQALTLHHRDPFDRALLAHAACEKFKFLTVDRTLELYRNEVDLIMT